MKSTPPRLTDVMLGLAVGDALGVPFEFQSRPQLDRAPCTGMVGHGSHNQPAGTWSDDTSMALILLETLQSGGTLADELAGYRRWYHDGYRTPHGVCFDIGGTTLQALGSGKGQTDERSNGNGSLMRIAPLAFFLEGMTEDQRRERCFAESAITHAHPRSQLACWLFVEVLIYLANPSRLSPPISLHALELAWYGVNRWVSEHPAFAVEWTHFSRCRAKTLSELPRSKVSSSGYVVHTLEAALWCVVTTTSYRDAVLAAVNLGSDTDTTGAVTGALAGLLYGREGIPQEWLEGLKGLDQISDAFWVPSGPCGRSRTAQTTN